MSTTVIASRMGVGLFLAPALAAKLDEHAVQQVLRRHGVHWEPTARSVRAPEFIAAQGLSPGDAIALSRDLETLGLVVRVVPDASIRTSRRVGNALALSFVVGSAIAMATVIAVTAGAWPVVAALSVFAAWALLNAASLALLGGASLPLSTVLQSTTPSLEDDLRALAEHLPDDLVRSMSERASVLTREAERDPDGPAARSLAELGDEVRALRREEHTRTAESLKQDLERARRALHEVHRTN